MGSSPGEGAMGRCRWRGPVTPARWARCSNAGMHRSGDTGLLGSTGILLWRDAFLSQQSIALYHRQPGTPLIAAKNLNLLRRAGESIVNSKNGSKEIGRSARMLFGAYARSWRWNTRTVSPDLFRASNKQSVTSVLSPTPVTKGSSGLLARKSAIETQPPDRTSIPRILMREGMRTCATSCWAEGNV